MRVLEAMKWKGMSDNAVAQVSQVSQVSEGATSSQHYSHPCTKVEPGTSGLVKIVINRPGNYCLFEDLHARIEFGDHAAEATLIQIYTGNVVLDLQGHTLGRGRIFKNPGGNGIGIESMAAFSGRYGAAENITIRNGRLVDFDVAIALINGRWRNPEDIPTHVSGANIYYFPKNNITFENVVFENNKKNFDIRIPGKPVETPPRDMSQYPPCGGTDYFGRPLIEGQPCDDEE